MALASEWEYVGRFTGTGLATAAVTDAAGTQILAQDRTRTALVIFNVGAGAAYVHNRPNLSQSHFPIPAGAVVSHDPFAPTNALWAAGDAGADLRIYQIVRRDVRYSG
jgi:hypothetical protein